MQEESQFMSFAIEFETGELTTVTNTFSADAGMVHIHVVEREWGDGGEVLSDFSEDLTEDEFLQKMAKMVPHWGERYFKEHMRDHHWATFQMYCDEAGW